jgi:hypothetical protein
VRTSTKSPAVGTDVLLPMLLGFPRAWVVINGSALVGPRGDDMKLPGKLASEPIDKEVEKADLLMAQ